MTITIENGSGVAGANAYHSAAYVTAYLTERNRLTENTWGSAAVSVQEAACIAAADYIEQRFRDLVRGVKEIDDTRIARAVLEFTAQPSDTETVTIGSVVYRAVNALAAANDFLIGSSLSATIDNLIAAVLASPAEAGTAFHAATVANADATAVAFYDDSALVYAGVSGTAGNSVATTTTITGATWNFATLNGGSDVKRSQPLSFPRLSLFDRDGNRIVGVPEGVKFASAEYAVRARASSLAPDPDIDSSGGAIVSLREKVGPIDTMTQYLPGSTGAGSLPAYPAADRFMAEFVRSSGTVIRG